MLQHITRRQWLQGAAAAGAAWTIVPRHGLGGANQTPPSERIGVGCVGVGWRGSYVGNLACALGNKVAAADVDRQRAERFAGSGPCVAYTDYRELLERDDVDVVTVGTPDHWHTKICIDAMKAGKDVFCEKPLTLTIDEGKKLCQVVRETGRMLQVGTQHRSSAQFLMAVAIAQSGRLGKQIKATCGLGPGRVSGVFATADPPNHLNWDAWLGQCPVVPYTPERCHGFAGFYNWLEYCGGPITNWGSHNLDIAQWALGYDHSGPVEAEGRGQFPNFLDDVDPVDFFAGNAKLPNAYNVATRPFDVTLTFANGSSMVATGEGHDILLEGEDGRIMVNRGRITGRPIEELTTADRQRLADEIVKLCKGRPIDDLESVVTGRDQWPPSAENPSSAELMANFFASVRDRQQPISDAFTHHRSVSSCHVGQIAMLLRRKLRWDPEKEDFIGDAQASALVSRPQREPYAI